MELSGNLYNRMGKLHLTNSALTDVQINSASQVWRNHSKDSKRKISIFAYRSPTQANLKSLFLVQQPALQGQRPFLPSLSSLSLLGHTGQYLKQTPPRQSMLLTCSWTCTGGAGNRFFSWKNSKNEASREENPSSVTVWTSKEGKEIEDRSL